MQMEKLTALSQQALQAADATARASAHPELTGTHILDALLKQREGLIPPLIRAAGADPEALARQCAVALTRLPTVSGASSGPGLAPAARQSLDVAFGLIERMGDDFVSTEHLLLGMLQQNDEAAR